VHGFIHDVRPVLDEATAYVCPIRDGGGTRIKVLDAMASCLPIIATTVACEGLKVTPERDLLIADTAAAFESQIARVFDSATLRHTLGRSARTVVEQHYSWNALADKLLSTYREVASRGVGPRLQGPNESRPRDNGV
jgi:glycosyltransferase involved in cell wall biosynthesis